MAINFEYVKDKYPESEYLGDYNGTLMTYEAFIMVKELEEKVSLLEKEVQEYIDVGSKSYIDQMSQIVERENRLKIATIGLENIKQTCPDELTRRKASIVINRIQLEESPNEDP